MIINKNAYIGIPKKIYIFFRDLFYAISIISISVLIVLNTTIVYRYVIEKYHLDKFMGLSTEVLIDNYNRVINYVQNPFNHELVLNSLPMSNFGKIHFYEVKRIFIALYAFSIIFILIMIFKAVKLIINKRSNSGKNLIESFNSSVNIIAIIFAFISAATIIDFPKTFYIFHKIFFRNNYWIFDPATDPIINALPEELFMIELILILALLIIFTVIIKILRVRSCYAKKRKV